MTNNNKILTVSYGTFSCTLEGFEDSFEAMKLVAEYFRDLAADDRYFGAEPPKPDAEMLARLAEKEISRRVEAHASDAGVHLRAGQAATVAAIAPAATAAETVQAEDIEVPAAEALSTLEPVSDVDDVEVTSPDESEIETDSIEDAIGSIADELADVGQSDPIDTAADLLVSSDTEETNRESATYIDADSDVMQASLSYAMSGFPGAAQTDDQNVNEMAVSKDDDIDEEIEEEFDGSVTLVDAEPMDDEVAVDTKPTSILMKLQRIREVVAKASATPDGEAENALEAQEETVAAEYDDADADLGTDKEFNEALATEPLEEDNDDILSAVASHFHEEATPENNEKVFVEETPFGAVAELAEPENYEPQDDVGDLIDEDALSEVLQQIELDDDDSASDLGANADVDQDDTVSAAFSDFSDDEEDEHTPAIASEMGFEDDEFDPDEVAAAPVDTATEPVEAEQEISLESSLSPEDEAELMRDLAAVEAEVEDRAFVDHDDASSARLLQEMAGAEEEALDRLMAEADSQMKEPEGNIRRNAFSHLRAAVAATKADDKLSTEGDASEDDYRTDLAAAVKPRRPVAGGGKRRARPGNERPAPLKLVAAQRIDTEVLKKSGPIRPRRVSAEAAETSDGDSFAEYASERGAHELPDILEAAASYLSFVEGRQQFSRPQLMTKVRQLNIEGFSREDGLRHFGQLLRAGKIEKIKGGRFTVSSEIGFRPDDHRQAG